MAGELIVGGGVLALVIPAMVWLLKSQHQVIANHIAHSNAIMTDLAAAIRELREELRGMRK